MLLGHYAVALAAKRAAPRSSLGTLFLAVQWLDEIWPILLLLGIERVRIVPGLMAASSMDFISYPFSHSLLAALVWSVILGLIYYARRRYRIGAYVVGIAVASHWVLDLVVHRPDLPLWPGSTRVGLGLWNSLVGTIVVELVLLAIGLFIYLRTTRPRDRIGRWGLGALVVVLVLLYLGGFSGPPPDPHALAIAALGLWIVVPWGYWIDRHRELRPDLSTDGAEPSDEVAQP